jgi:hypothetical protein
MKESTPPDSPKNPAAAPTSSNWKRPEHRILNSFYYLHNAHGDLTPEYKYDTFGNLSDESEPYGRACNEISYSDCSVRRIISSCTRGVRVT